MSLYPLMYLDKKRNKDFSFFVVSHRLFLNCVSIGVHQIAAIEETELRSSVGLGIKNFNTPLVPIKCFLSR